LIHRFRAYVERKVERVEYRTVLPTKLRGGAITRSMKEADTSRTKPMLEGTTIYAIHERLIRDTFGRDPSDRDAFLLFTILYTHRLDLAPG
jgi:hypothetical protein